MTTPKQYSVLDDKSYKVDSAKEKRPYRSGSTFYEDEEHKTGQEYKVLNTIDTNDKYNSQGYEKNGFQGMIVAPMIYGKVDYSHLIIAYAGTNFWDPSLNDISEDAFGVVGGLKHDGTLDSQFTSAQQFYNEMSQIYGASNIDSVTGHSLGGALAQKVAAANHIPAVTFSTAGVGSQLTEAEKKWINGEGKEFILNFMHKGDQVPGGTNAKGFGTAIYTEDFGSGLPFSGHFLTSYEFSEDGSLIDTKGGVWSITDKGTLKNGVSLIQKSFKSQIKGLNNLKSKFTSSGGGLSSGEKIYLDDAQALVVVSTVGAEFNLSMVNVMKNYQDGIKESEKLWKDTFDKSMGMGNLLETWEI